MTWKNERKGWGLIAGPTSSAPAQPVPCAPDAPSSGGFRRAVSFRIVFLVSRHLRFGWDTPLKVNRDALWDLKQNKNKSKGRVSSLVFLERGGELLSQRVSFLPEQRPACGLRARRWTGKETEVRAAGGSEGSDTGGVLLMASSTSDFWREVLKTPS